MGRYTQLQLQHWNYDIITDFYFDNFVKHSSVFFREHGGDCVRFSGTRRSKGKTFYSLLLWLWIQKWHRCRLDNKVVCFISGYNWRFRLTQFCCTSLNQQQWAWRVCCTDVSSTYCKILTFVILDLLVQSLRFLGIKPYYL